MEKNTTARSGEQTEMIGSKRRAQNQRNVLGQSAEKQVRSEVSCLLDRNMRCRSFGFLPKEAGYRENVHLQQQIGHKDKIDQVNSPPGSSSRE
jgi:16S rRNA U1498 N3-methylase RsmE